MKYTTIDPYALLLSLLLNYTILTILVLFSSPSLSAIFACNERSLLSTANRLTLLTFKGYN